MEERKAEGVFWIVPLVVGLTVAVRAIPAKGFPMLSFKAGGVMLGLFLFAWLLSGLVWLAWKAMGRPLNRPQYLATYGVAFLVLALGFSAGK